MVPKFLRPPASPTRARANIVYRSPAGAFPRLSVSQPIPFSTASSRMPLQTVGFSSEMKSAVVRGGAPPGDGIGAVDWALMVYVLAFQPAAVCFALRLLESRACR